MTGFVSGEIDGGTLDQSKVADIARCYIQQQNNFEGANWFAKIADLNDCLPAYLFEYGQCLKSLNLYGKAKFYFQKYASYDPVVGHQFMQSCDIAKMLQEGEELYTVIPKKSNTAETEFAPSVSDDVVYISTLDITGTPSFKIITGQGVKEVAGANRAGYGYRLSADGNHLVYTTQKFDAGARLIPTAPGGKMYVIDRMSSGEWSTPMLLPIGDPGYAVAYPFLSEGGDKLFFASDMVGGQGGWDIYVSNRNGDEWSIPENVGSKINTPGNEISPSISGEDLYFASDWHVGLGGLDVFVSTRSMYGYSDVRPVGYPVNSSKDDLDFVWDKDSQQGYFISNRVGGVGSYDLYAAISRYSECQILVKHKESMKPLANAMVVTTPGISRATYTDDQGRAIVRYMPSSSHQVRVQLEGYVDYEMPLPGSEKPAFVNREILLDPVPQKPVLQATNTKPVVKPAPAAEEPRAVPPVAKAPVATPSTGQTAEPASSEERYFIQIAALARNSDISPYADLRMYGDLVVHDDDMYSRVRVGTFVNESDARSTLEQVRAGGYQDAFVVKYAVEKHPVQSVRDTEYKVRLGTYAKVGSFDPTPLVHLGTIESYRKDDLTIMLLAGYHTLSAAQRAREAAVVQGFKDAYVVMDNNGVLEKVR